jgi:hypothetical protein
MQNNLQPKTSEAEDIIPELTSSKGIISHTFTSMVLIFGTYGIHMLRGMLFATCRLARLHTGTRVTVIRGDPSSVALMRGHGFASTARFADRGRAAIGLLAAQRTRADAGRGSWGQ